MTNCYGCRVLLSNLTSIHILSLCIQLRKYINWESIMHFCLLSASKVNLGKFIQKKIQFWNSHSQRSHKSCQSYITLGLKNVYTTTKQILISPIKSSDRSWVSVAPISFIITPDFFVVFTESDQKFILMRFFIYSLKGMFYSIFDRRTFKHCRHILICCWKWFEEISFAVLYILVSLISPNNDFLYTRRQNYTK